MDQTAIGSRQVGAVGNTVTAAMLPLLAADHPLTRGEVEQALSVKLALKSDLGGDGQSFEGANEQLGISIQFFSSPLGRFNLGLKPTNGEPLEDWEKVLEAAGWTSQPAITHPFLLASFRKGERQVRIENDGVRALRIELLN